MAQGAPTSTSAVISGVATKTTYASFLLYGLFHSKVLGEDALNTKALVYNIKGEDLLFLDHTNARLDEKERGKYEKLGLPTEPFGSVVPDVATPSTASERTSGRSRTSAARTSSPSCSPTPRTTGSKYTLVVHNVAARLREAEPLGDGGVVIEGVTSGRSSSSRASWRSTSRTNPREPAGRDRRWARAR